MILDDISRSNVEAAIAEFKSEGRSDGLIKKYKLHKNSHSRNAYLVIDGDFLDAKLILRIAHFFTKQGGVLGSNDFSGGMETIRALQKLGYNNFQYKGKSIGDMEGLA